MGTRILISLAMAVFLGLAPLRAVYAADRQDDLRAEIKALNARVAELEKQLIQKEGAALANSSPMNDSWDPFLEIMGSQMKQMFQDSIDRGFGAGRVNLLGPRTDIQETPTHYILTMDLPGMNKENINVQVKNNTLLVSGERNAQTEVRQGDQMYRQERSFGQFSRAIPLPDGIKTDDVKADYKDGVLEVKIGRVDNGTPDEGSRIPVN